MSIKISVVIPTYRRPQLLQKCLQALQNQRFEPSGFEVIVVSDGPDEPSAACVRQLGDPRFRVLSLEEKKGPAAARNLGWQQARGKLIAFTDDDCLPDAGWLEAFWQGYRQESLIAFTGAIKVPRPARPTDFEQNTAHLETADFVTANCCCSREALIRTGGFDERFSMAWREDSDLEFKLLQQGIPIIRNEQALVVHPVRQAPWGVSIKEQKKGMFNALLYKKYPELYRQRIQPGPPWDYYLIVAGTAIGLYGLAMQRPWVTAAGLISSGILLGRFIYRRLARTSRAPSHIAEMALTSLVIPFASVYWQLYGAWRYRVLFL